MANHLPAYLNRLSASRDFNSPSGRASKGGLQHAPEKSTESGKANSVQGEHHMATGAERRRHERANIRWPATVETSRGLMEGETKNVSQSGAYIECALPSEPGEEVTLRILPPDRAPLKIAAEVIWTAGNSPFGMGMVFTEISEEDRTYIAEAVMQATKGRSLR
jgi:hypothetical protein